jgi:hypothetical protein
MIVNFRISRVSQDAHKLVRTPTVTGKKKREYMQEGRERELALLLNGILASICISDIIKLSLSATN